VLVNKIMTRYGEDPERATLVGFGVQAHHRQHARSAEPRLIAELTRRGAQISAYDPVAMGSHIRDKLRGLSAGTPPTRGCIETSNYRKLVAAGRSAML